MVFSLIFHMGFKVQVVPAGIYMIPISIILTEFAIQDITSHTELV